MGICVVCKTIQRPPYRTLILAKFYLGFQHSLVFSDIANLHLGVDPKVNFTVSENFSGNKPRLVHGRKYAIVK